MLPSSDLAGMLLPAIHVRPVGIWGTLSSSDYDPAGQNGPHVTGGSVGHLETLSPATSESGILVDPGGMFPSSDLARMRGPAPPAGSAVLRGPVGPAMSLETLLLDVDVPRLCQIVLTVGLLPGVAVPLPAMWDPLFALSPVEELKGTGAEVVGGALLYTVVGLVRTLLGSLPWLLGWACLPCYCTFVLRRIVQSGAQSGMVVVIVRTGQFMN